MFWAEVNKILVDLYFFIYSEKNRDVAKTRLIGLRDKILFDAFKNIKIRTNVGTILYVSIKMM